MFLLKTQKNKTLHSTIETGWWLTYPSEKYDFVSWDDYSQYMESHKIHVPNHQPGNIPSGKLT